VSDEQVIAQVVKPLRVGPLHSHLVREQPKIVLEPYDQFAKFSKSEILHFQKLEQERKVAKPDEAPRPCHSDSHHSYPKPVHNIGHDSDGASKNWNKGYREPSHHSDSGTLNQRLPQSNQQGGQPRTEVVGEAEDHTRQDLCIACTTAMKPTIAP
jgi:hypothetical protein